MSRGSLPVVLVVAAALRLAIPAFACVRAGSVTVLRTADSPQYLEAARSLWEDARYDGPLGPELMRPPGYPLFLIPGVALGHPELWAASAQALLGCLTVWLVYLAGRRLDPDPRAALTAAWLVALDPTHLAWSGRVMAEVPFTCLVAAALYGLVEHWRSGKRRWLMVATLAAGSSAYVRFVGYAMPAIVAIALFLTATGRRRRAAGAAALVVGGGLLMAAPWHVRNGRVADYWGFSSQPDRFLAFSTVAALEAEARGDSMTELRARARSRALTPGNEDGRLYRALRASALDRVRDEPLAVARTYLSGCLRTLLLPGALSLLEAFGPLPPGEKVASHAILDGDAAAALSVAPRRVQVTGALLALAQVPIWLGVGLALRRGRPEIWMLVLVALGLTLVSGGPWGSSRFRHPIVPFLALASGCGLAKLGRVSLDTRTAVQ
jgi:4-amino-4-deoxy-L-arabinose transferase-like glycosyltransferase